MIIDATQRRAVGARETGVPARLLAAAQALIAEGGTAAATSRAITQRAGENLASITYYFGSKETLVSEALISRARALVEPVLTELTSDRPQLEKLTRGVELLTHLFVEHSADRPAYLECLTQAGRDESLAVAVRALTRELRDRLAQEMADQLDQGTIPAWVQPDAMAALIVALVNGVLASAVVDPEQTDVATIAQQFAALLLGAAGRGERPDGPAT
jgi:AcrR family transcriptional regulator